ncbi:MAG: glycosyltransferase [Wenzhouxiangella sp.]
MSALWWVISLYLAKTSFAVRREVSPVENRHISVFKSVPASLEPARFDQMCDCIESFVAGLDENSEMLLGHDASDHERLERLARDWRKRYPAAKLKLIAYSGHDQFANPKISCMKELAAHATGELWLWSDADMRAPRDFIQSLRSDFTGQHDYVVSPYLIREADCAAGYLDKLFVNVEFYPGVLLLARLGDMKIGFGSGMLFPAKRFQQRVDWDSLGACLADDYHLARALGRGKLGQRQLETVSSECGWRRAWTHYYRWQKTIRWTQPGGYAMQLAVMPILGWLAWAISNPALIWPWVGLGANMALDIIASVVICRALGCPVSLRFVPSVAVWSLARPLTWLVTWLPLPVVWSGKRWWSPIRKTTPGFSSLLISILLVGCASFPDLPPADLSEPGWTVWTGQVVWKPRGLDEAIAGELIVGRHTGGESLILLAKPPLTIFVAQTSEETWQIKFSGDREDRAGRLPPPRQFVWFSMPDLLEDGVPPRGWNAQHRPPDTWELEHPGGETIRLVLDR